MKRTIILPCVEHVVQIDIYDNGADVVVTDPTSLQFHGISITTDENYLHWLRVNQPLAPSLLDAGIWYKHNVDVEENPYIEQLNAAIKLCTSCLTKQN